MKSLLSSLVAAAPRLIAGALLAVSRVVAPVEAAPRLVCEQPVFVFGTVTDDAVVRHRFVLANHGRSELVIRRVHAGCGCTTTVTDSNKVPPGQSTGIEAVLSLRDRAGPQRHSILVESNDPDEPRFFLWMQGEVEPEIALDPPSLNFGKIDSNATTSAYVRVRSRRPDTRIARLEMASAAFSARLVGDSDALHPDTAVIEVALRPPLSDGRIVERLLVHTTHPERPIVALPVRVTVEGEISVEPDVLRIRRPSKGTVAAHILLRPGTRNDYRVIEALAPHPAIRTTFEELFPGLWRIDLASIPTDPTLDGREIVIRTDLPAHSTIRVPLRWIE